MSHASRLAVELTKGQDNLDIWVDANNNGVRDDDDVNIYITAGGGFYTTSPTFKHALDSTIQNRIKQLAVNLLTKPEESTLTEEILCELALELVVKAQDLQPTLEVEPAPTTAWDAQPSTANWEAVSTANEWQESPPSPTHYDA